MFDNLFPDDDAESSYDIDYEKYLSLGYRGIMFDIDNTLVEHGYPANRKSVELFRKLHSMGFSTCLISNNRKSRVRPFAEAMKTPFISMAGKPASRGYLEGMKIMHTDRKNTLFVGDQLFTDILGARRAGVYCILVKPVARHEEIQIVLKRIIEKPFLAMYRKRKRNTHI